jgi:hypothetical protein
MVESTRQVLCDIHVPVHRHKYLDKGIRRMEGIERFHSYIKSLSYQARILAEVAASLNKSFEAEADWLTREDEAKLLETIRVWLTEKLHRAKRQEDSASEGYNKAKTTLSLTGLALKLIVVATIENQRARNFVNHVFDTSKVKTRPYGKVMICVGEKGLPDDAQVVSISELARKSNRSESEIIQELQKTGNLLFSQGEFSRLIDKLLIDVREGLLHLPLPNEKLAEMIASGYLNLKAERLEWVPYSRRQ